MGELNRAYDALRSAASDDEFDEALSRYVALRHDWLKNGLLVRTELLADMARETGVTGVAFGIRLATEKMMEVFEEHDR